MKKILTIVIPTYNMEAYLDRCLSSLILDDKDLMAKLEVLVVIDGATDGSSRIAHSYETSYPDTFCVIDKENGNYGSCVNRGLKEANGKYIKVLDADDRFGTQSFQAFLTMLDTIDVDCIMSDTYKEESDGTICQKIMYSFPHSKVFSIEEVIKVPSEHMWMHSVTYRTALLRRISYHQTEGISYTEDRKSVV